MPYNIATHLHENELGILTAANGNLTSRYTNFGEMPDIERLGFDFENLRVHSILSNNFEWTQQIADEQIVYSRGINTNLQHIIHGNPTIGATSCFRGYNYPNPLTLATLGRLTGCTALVLVLRNGVLSLHAGNDNSTVDESQHRNEIYQAGNGSLQRAYRGWLYQLVWKHLSRENIPLDRSNANVRNSIGEETFNNFLDPVVFANSLLQLDVDFANVNNGQQILWGNLLHNNRNVEHHVDNRVAGLGNRQIFIGMYDTDALTMGGLYYLVNTLNNTITASTLSCIWLATQGRDRLALVDARLTNRRIQQNA